MEPTAKVAIDVIIAWAAIMTLLVTIIVGIMAFNLYRQWREARELVDGMSSQVKALEERYQLARLKSPEEILREARFEFDPQMRELTRHLHRYSEEGLKGVADLRGDFELRIKAIDERQKSQSDVERGIFRQVLNAFLEVKNLSDAERTAISRALSSSNPSVVIVPSPSSSLVDSSLIVEARERAALEKPPNN